MKAIFVQGGELIPNFISTQSGLTEVGHGTKWKRGATGNYCTNRNSKGGKKFEIGRTMRILVICDISQIKETNSYIKSFYF